jgi:two-component system, OmpR family, KDP operon response regulator KdpE
MMNTSRSSTSATKRPLIVCVDDEADILEMLELALEDEGFDVFTVQRSVEAADVVRDKKPSLVLLDLLMPEMNGFEVLQELRSFSAVPVMILTARGNSRDVVEGLERGADDYLPKPFNLGELAARVRAVLRRSKQDSPAALGVATFGNVSIDFVRRQVGVNGQPIHLTRNEWRLLEQFARNPGRIISHEELLTQAWGSEFSHDVDYLRVWLSRLRRKLTDAGAPNSLIRTASGMGYAFGLEEVSQGLGASL